MKSTNTKRALLLSVLSMMLCVVMLAGSTFAWFTDSVTSGANRIVAGNLDVELEYSLTGDADSWLPVDENTNLFKPAEETLWEPGHTEYVYLRIHNAGTLALKYQFDINVFGDEAGGAEKEYTNVKNEKFKLSKYLVFNQLEGVVPANTRESLWLASAEEEAAKMGDLSSLGLDSSLSTSKLLAGEETLLTLAVYMPTQVGNEANQLTSAKETEGQPTIYLGLNLTATQVPHEQDSFDENYDAGLTPTVDGIQKVLEDNTVLYYTNEGEVLLYDTQSVTIGGDGVYKVPNGVTSIGVSAFRYNQQIKEIVLPDSVNKLNINAFRGTSAERIVLNEGLTSIGERVFRDANNLKEVVIPSTVTKIEKMAFQLCGMTELTIPATVTTIEEGAFRDMPNLETLTIEGNPTIANFAGRSCPKLQTVTLTGDDVTFTGNSMVFTHADTGDANGITINVVNETVKERVIAAQKSARGYAIEVINVDEGNFEDEF